MFLDVVEIHLAAGRGGDGASTMRREAHVPRGGPDGGDGGRGGSIYVTVDPGQTTLRDFEVKRRYVAGDATGGGNKTSHGKAGRDLVIGVPPGTAIFDAKSGDLVADLVSREQSVLLVRGGRGGLGNAHFTTATHQAPRHAQKGEPGEQRDVRLELRLIADVGLVGLPNAGKSTLLAALTAAQPKIGDYAFTTLEPNLGVVRVDDRTEFVVADIPGLIEGAAEGRGLGHRFLRHIERARVLCVLVDLASIDGTTPEHQIAVLLDELGRYDPDLLERPRVVVGTKTDSAPPDVLASWSGPAISAVTNQGVRDLVGRLASLVHEARDAEPVSEGRVILRPESDGAWVERLGDRSLRVHGRKVLRAVHLNDVTTPEALGYIDDRLKKLGVPRLLTRAGAREGDVVWIGDFSFEYHPDR